MSHANASSYLRYHFYRVFRDAWNVRNYDPHYITCPAINDVILEQAAAAISKSQQPVMIIGSQAMLNAAEVRQ